VGGKKGDVFDTPRERVRRCPADILNIVKIVTPVPIPPRGGVAVFPNADKPTTAANPAAC
jgi:hypothetical protein